MMKMEGMELFEGISNKDLMTGIPSEILYEQAPESVSSMNLEEFLPSRLVEMTFIYTPEDMTIWEPIIIDTSVEIGPRRMLPLFFNDRESLILNYIYIERKLNYLFVRRMISEKKHSQSMRDIKRKVEFIEEAITKSIKREKLPKDHEDILVSILKEQLNRGFRFRNKNGYGNWKRMEG